MPRYNIDERLEAIGKSNVDVVRALLDKGYVVDPGAFSRYKTGAIRSPKADVIMEAADKLISEWEQRKETE